MENLIKSVKLIQSVGNKYFLFEYVNGSLSVKKDKKSYLFGANGIATLLGHTVLPKAIRDDMALPKQKMLARIKSDTVITKEMSVFLLKQAKTYIRRDTYTTSAEKKIMFNF